MSPTPNYKGKRMLGRAEKTVDKWAFGEEQSLEGKRLVLFDNVQFIYELALAQLELQSLGIRYRMTNGLREFEPVGEIKEVESLKRRLAYFKVVEGDLTDYFHIVRKNRTRSVNQYLTHWIYPYKGKFHPQMIRALLNIIGLKEGDTVLDPFIGSGTTAVEAQLLGIKSLGIDVSPLCVLQSKVKTESVSVLSEIRKWEKKVVSALEHNLFEQDSVCKLDDIINDITDEKVRNFYRMVKLVAVSDKARRRREFTSAFRKNLHLMLASVKDYAEIAKSLNLALGEVDIRIGDSRELPFKSNSIDGVVTSPPYSIALDYVSNDAHSLKELKYDLIQIREKFIGVRGVGQRKIALYNEDMQKSLDEIWRVLKPGRFAVIVIGNATYQGKEIRTVEFVIEYAESIGFRLVRNIDKIIFGLYNVMRKENILLFQK